MDRGTRHATAHRVAKSQTGLKGLTDLEPDILECEVKWALVSITMNKASGGDGISVDTNTLFIYITLFYRPKTIF